MNTLAYILYLLITYVITVHVGMAFYKNGRVFILSLLHHDHQLTDAINRILLTGYYLLNLGYVALALRCWDTITTWDGLLASIGSMSGKILLTLAFMHFCNMGAIYLLSKRKQSSIHSKI